MTDILAGLDLNEPIEPKIFVWDIETVPGDHALSQIEDAPFYPESKLSDLDSPPATITKIKGDELRAERLAEWQLAQAHKLNESVENQRKKAINTLGLHWWSGKIVCIVVLTKDEIHSDYNRHVFSGEDERTLLLDFCEWVGDFNNPLFVGKSSEQFDRPFFIGRCLAHNIPIPYCFRPKGVVADIDHIFSRSQSCGQVSKLDNYALGLGIQGKTGSGSEVADMVAAGQWDKLINYCTQDDLIAMELLTRFLRSPYGAINQAGPRAPTLKEGKLPPGVVKVIESPMPPLPVPVESKADVIKSKSLPTLSKYLRERRQAAKLSQKAVAEKLGFVSAQFVSNFEIGKVPFPVKHAPVICDLYGVSRAELTEVIVSESSKCALENIEKSFEGQE